MPYGGMQYDEYPSYNRTNYNDATSSRNMGTIYGNNKPAAEVTTDYDSAIKTQAEIEYNAQSIGGYTTPYQSTGSQSETIKITDNSRRIDGPLDNELQYSDYNLLPIAAGYKSHAYEYGYSFLPPEKWYPQPPRPPICVTEKRAAVCPVYTDGAPVDVKEFYSSNRITPPDLINTDYVNEKLNAGR
jgi:hypothetical protein